MWIKIHPDSAEQFCQNKESEAWSLAAGKEGIIYLQHEADPKSATTGRESDPFSFNLHMTNQGFDFTPSRGSVFGTPPTATGTVMNTQ